MEHRGAHRRGVQPDARVVRAGRAAAVRAHPVGEGQEPPRAPAQGRGAPGAAHRPGLRLPGGELARHRAAQAPRAAVVRDRRDHAQLAQGGGEAGGGRRGALLDTGDAAHVPALLGNAPALSPPAAQGHSGAGGAQGRAIDRGVHKSVCAGRGGDAGGVATSSGEGAEAAAVLRSLPPA